MFFVPKNHPHKKICQAFRDESGKSRQRYVANVHMWPKKDADHLKRLCERCQKAFDDSLNLAHTESFRIQAKEIYDRLYISIDKLKKSVDAQVARARAAVDRRRLDPETGRRKINFARPYLFEPEKDFISSLIRSGIRLEQIELRTPMEKWPKFYLRQVTAEGGRILKLLEKAKRLASA